MDYIEKNKYLSLDTVYATGTNLQIILLKPTFEGLVWGVTRRFEYENDYVKLNIKITIFKMKTDRGVFYRHTQVYRGL